MNKKTIVKLAIIIVLIIILGVLIKLYVDGKNSNLQNMETSEGISMDENEHSGPPEGGPGGNGAPGGNENSANVSHTGATEISTDTTSDGQTYSSADGSQSALLVTGGTSTISNATITKTGDSDGDNSDFYGTNAAVLVKEGTLNIKGGYN